jgi:hypothetical protein
VVLSIKHSLHLHIETCSGYTSSKRAFFFLWVLQVPLKHHSPIKMKASTLAPLTLLAFMATIQYSCALPAPDLLKRVPVANPSLPFPQPSIGHGPVSIPSTLPTPIVQPRDSTAVQRRGAPICPLGTSQGPDGTCHGTTSPGTPIQRREVPICPLGTSQGPDGTCHGTTSPGTPIQRRGVPICPLGTSQGPEGTCHGTTSPGTPI